MSQSYLQELAYAASGKSEDDSLLNTAKRYRVDAEKIQKAVAQEFAAKLKKKEHKASSKKAV